MQPIQDRDFDQLFENTFEEAEIAPSRDLWGNIEKELAPKKKRIIPIYWLSAAAVLLIATVGILVYQQQEVKPKQFAKHVEPKAIKPLVETQPVQNSIKTVAIPKDKASQALPINQESVIAVAKTTVKEKVKPLEKQKVATAPDIQKPEEIVAKVDDQKQEIIKKKIEEVILQPKAETVFASNLNSNKIDEPVNENLTENKSIRNVGDVVNLIVNKVDKRKDKFIQFKTDDDDNSSVTSINIGPFKFGKRSNK